VPEARLDAFVERFATATDRLVLGDPLDPASTLGPLALPTDPARVAELVADSGAHTVTSSVEVPERGYYARPSIAVRPAATSRIVTEEIFGPAVSVCGYRELDEVLGATRANQYGLGGYVVGSPSRAAECASALDVGIVGVNTGTPNTPQVPFAGLKHSGLGAEGGQAGLDAFLTAQTVTEGLAV
jgi:succinate-semialdehyde dehydrogenase / glutarate-semialdehyde dehydrogenase